MMNNNGGRPLGMRKTVQLMVILTILAWATQTLLSQWGYGATLPVAGQWPEAKLNEASRGGRSRG